MLSKQCGIRTGSKFDAHLPGTGTIIIIVKTRGLKKALQHAILMRSRYRVTFNTSPREERMESVNGYKAGESGDHLVRFPA